MRDWERINLWSDTTLPEDVRLVLDEVLERMKLVAIKKTDDRGPLVKLVTEEEWQNEY